HPEIRCGRIEQRQIVVLEIDQLDVDVATRLGMVENPLRRLVAETGGPDARDDHGNLWLGHWRLLHSLKSQIVTEGEYVPREISRKGEPDCHEDTPITPSARPC